MSWGQREIWLAIGRLHSSLGVGGIVPLARHTTLADVEAMLRFLMCRHQSLRTRISFGADGQPHQVVSSAGEVPLEIVDVAEDADPQVVAGAVWNRYYSREFDYSGEWPIRMAAVRHRGALTHMVALCCHLATDGVGADLLRLDMSKVDTATMPPVTAMQPLDQARWQRSQAGRQQNHAALRYVEGMLRTISARRFPEPGEKREPRYREINFSSPAAHLAALRSAERLGVRSSTVLLAAFAMALAQVTGINPVAVQVLVNNRFRPGLTDSVSTLSHAGLCVIDIDGLSFEQAVPRAWRALLRAYKNAYYDPDQMLALVDRIGRERGVEIDRDCFFNDRRAYRIEAPGPIDERDVRAARRLTTLRWVPPRDVPCERFFFHVNDVPDTIDVRLSMDAHHVPAADAEEFLLRMEALVIDAALAPAGDSGARGRRAAPVR
ncbi:MAG: condensation domain-containing protein [Labedaea sp.]